MQEETNVWGDELLLHNDELRNFNTSSNIAMIGAGNKQCGVYAKQERSLAITKAMMCEDNINVNWL
jgi:hypothetical protein